VSGAGPVRDWLQGIAVADRKVLGYDIGLVEFGWPLGGGLWEVRSTLIGNRIARVIFCITECRMVLLHGFIKKAQAAPKTDLDPARDRRKDVQR